MRVSSPVNPLTSRAQRFCDADDKRHIRVLLKCQDESLHLWKDKLESVHFWSAPGGESYRIGHERSATVHGDVLPANWGALQFIYIPHHQNVMPA
jgi:hypothetical protein